MLIFLVFVPLLIGIGGFIFGKGKITLKEFFVQEILVVIVIAIGYEIALWAATHDTEVWNGWAINAEHYEEWWERVSCRHPRSCSHRDRRGHSLHSNDGYYHSYDEDYHAPYWQTLTSNGETVGISSDKYSELRVKLGVDREHYASIVRWNKTRGPGGKFVCDYISGKSLLVPTSVEHSYTNYIKANPDTVLRRSGQGEKFLSFIPDYPRVHNYIECGKFLSVGVNVLDAPAWQEGLLKINANLGSKKQVNIIMLVVGSADSAYVHALEEAWIGGKKNDFVVVCGVTKYPQIDWVRIMSWTKREDLKVELRDAILETPTLYERQIILDKISNFVDKKFTRTPMEDFGYVMASFQPSFWPFLTLMILGIGSSIGLTILFIKNDPFGDRSRSLSGV